MNDKNIMVNSNIIVVDDKPENLRLIDATLKTKVASLRLFTRGAQVLASAKLAAPDLFLLDINMPQMDGYQLCKLIKQESALSTIPIIFLSCFTTTFDKVKGFDAGGDDYMTKPFQREEFEARIKIHLERYQYQQDLKQKNIELQDALAENVAMKKQAIQLEKTTAVNELIRLIAHSINTPLGVAISALSTSMEVAIKVNDNLKNKTLTSLELQKSVTSIIKAEELSLSNLLKTIKLIDGLQLLPDNSEVICQQVQLKGFFDDVFSIFKMHHPTKNLTFTLDIVDDLTVTICKPIIREILLALMELTVEDEATKEQHHIVLAAKISPDQHNLLLNYYDDTKNHDVDLINNFFTPSSPLSFSLSSKSFELHIIKHLTDRLLGTCQTGLTESGMFEFSFQFPRSDISNNT